jgi:hypothetical protein
LVAVAGAEARCSRVTAQGEGLTKELAQDMAKMNLEFAVVSKGAKSAGKVSYKCGAPGPLSLTSCKAMQRACT